MGTSTSIFLCLPSGDGCSCRGLCPRAVGSYGHRAPGLSTCVTRGWLAWDHSATQGQPTCLALPGLSHGSRALCVWNPPQRHLQLWWAHPGLPPYPLPVGDPHCGCGMCPAGWLSLPAARATIPWGSVTWRWGSSLGSLSLPKGLDGVLPVPL